ncbi:MAG: hypothetical protein K2Q10_04805, partial [Rhodospirillales bacterium]|nr:hypothetical protein [Rhodospirillales bacterium]
LHKAFNDLRDHAPDTITQYERLVFFEGQDDEVLLTPIVSLKMVHEMNHRLKERRDHFFQARMAGEKSAVRLLDKVTFPIGGANPQNVGYVVNKGTRNTRHGRLPVLTVTCPEDRRSQIQRRFATMGGARSYLRVASVDKTQLGEYGRRAAIQIGLATHRQAEARQAQEIARQFIEARIGFHPLLATMKPLDEVEPWKAMDADELAWIDPRVGEFHREVLADRFAQEVKARVERVMNANRSGDTSQSPFMMDDRSVESLIEAFKEIL